MKELTSLDYDRRLKPYSRILRTGMTVPEKMLWSKIRKRQVLGIRFYRQRPLSRFIVDFFAPKPRVVIELDGIQHTGQEHAYQDSQRDAYFKNHGMIVLRYSNTQIKDDLESIVLDISGYVQSRI